MFTEFIGLRGADVPTSLHAFRSRSSSILEQVRIEPILEQAQLETRQHIFPSLAMLFFHCPRACFGNLPRDRTSDQTRGIFGNQGIGDASGASAAMCYRVAWGLVKRTQA